MADHMLEGTVKKKGNRTGPGRTGPGRTGPARTGPKKTTPSSSKVTVATADTDKPVNGYSEDTTSEDKALQEYEEEDSTSSVLQDRRESESSDRAPSSNGLAGNEEDENEKEKEEGEVEEGEQEEELAEEVVDPEDFDSKSFLSTVSDLSQQLQSDSYKHIDSDFPSDTLASMVQSVTSTLTSFKAYSLHSQKQLEALRHQMKDVKDRIHKRIHNRSYDPRNVRGRVSLEERELEAKLAQLNKEIARAAEELSRASQITAETEGAAIEASLVAERAAEDAQRIQAEYEQRRKAELEERKAEEERRAAEERKREEEAQRLEEKKKAEDERRARLRREEGNQNPDWEEWPTYTYRVDPGEFDGGIGCIIRGHPDDFKENMVSCEVLDQLDTNFTYNDNDELVSNIIRLSLTDEDNQLKEPIVVVLPHCTSRVSAMTREPVIKAEIDGTWQDIKSYDVTFEDKKDLKFVQAEITQLTCLAVVTRFKRDYLYIPKRGGKIVSNVDSRVTFTVERGTFKELEHFELQLQPVDSNSIVKIKTKDEGCQGLLTCSSIVQMEWTSPIFDNPVTMTLPCPPNPVKAKKAAVLRAVKEAKMKNPPPPPQPPEETERKPKHHQEVEEDQSDGPPPPRWYMGQYGNNKKEKSTDWYLMTQSKTGRWTLRNQVKVNQVKLDLLQFDLCEPLPRFMVLRTRTNVEVKEAQHIATVLEKYLCQRIVQAVLKQRGDDLCDVVVHMIPQSRSAGLLSSLEEDGFEEGPGASTDLIVREGDIIEVGCRGNITVYEDTPLPITMVYNSQLPTFTGFYVVEVNRFLQKSYTVYRGFVQTLRKVTTEHKPTKREEEEGQTETKVDVQRELLCEHLITIPKDQNAPMTPVLKAPVVIKSDRDPVNDDCLRQLAKHLGNEWRKLSQHLNIKPVRIQAILRNHANNEQTDSSDEDIKYEMLVTWAKRVPHGWNKLEILKSALVNCGRIDLIPQLDQMNQVFRQKQAGYD